MSSSHVSKDYNIYLKVLLKLYGLTRQQYDIHKNSPQKQENLREHVPSWAFPFSVKLKSDNLVTHSGVGEYKKRTCAARPVMKVNHFVKI
jgi:hypothetical protein